MGVKEGDFMGKFFVKNIWAFVLVAAMNANVVLGNESIETGLKTISVTTDIDATPDEVWNALVDFEGYGDWNQWYGIEGPAIEGARVQAVARGGGTRLDLEITQLAPYTICWNDVTWFTHLGMGGWRCRSIVERADGQGVRFINYFHYTGPLNLFLQLGTRKTLVEGMKLENRGLKRFVEDGRGE